VVITGSASDPADLRPHIRSKKRNVAIQDRLRDPSDPLRMVIVRDMWLTGFDCPPLHTLYVDKPMKGHTLMQAIARVNRVFKDKPGGLVADYIGLGEWLKRALRDYTESNGRGEPAVDIRAAITALEEKLEVCRTILYGFDYQGYRSPHATLQLKALTGSLDFIEGKESARDRFLAASGQLLVAFRLAGAAVEALRHRDEIAFLLAIRGRLAKLSTNRQLAADELEFKVGQIVSRAVMSGGVRDIFAEAGIDHPNVSLIDEQFLAEVRELPQRNLAAAALERLLRDEIKVRLRKNMVEAARFSELLNAVMVRYHNRAIEAAQVVLELVELANQLRDQGARGEQLGLNEEELAFYDALTDNRSAVELMEDETLRAMARELAETLRRSITVDWQVKDSVRAALRAQVRRLLRRYKYPPDHQERATELVLGQAEVLGEEWVPAVQRRGSGAIKL
jgi:type I restriction enzyme R subunit